MTKKRATKPPGTLSVYAIDLRVGDRFTDEASEWEVVGRPYSMQAGKVIRVRIQQPGEPATATDVTWPAYERITIRRREREAGT